MGLLVSARFFLGSFILCYSNISASWFLIRVNPATMADRPSYLPEKGVHGPLALELFLVSQVPLSKLLMKVFQLGFSEVRGLCISRKQVGNSLYSYQ